MMVTMKFFVYTLFYTWSEQGAFACDQFQLVIDDNSIS